MAEIRPPADAAMAVAASALRAQQSRMRVIAENIANANSSRRRPGGDPYRRQIPVFTDQDPARRHEGRGHDRRRPTRRDFKTEYDPGNPAADAKGYVKMPNVDAADRGPRHARGPARLRGQPQRDRDRARHGDRARSTS